ncbi:MAG: hypothetical protein ACMUIP_14645 [bacterium]
MKKENKINVKIVLQSIFILLIIIIIGGIAKQTIGNYKTKAQGCKCQHTCQNNLAEIILCEEAYYEKCGMYLECKPYPTDLYAGLKLNKWDAKKAGNFSVIGFAPKTPVHAQYMVRVSDDGQRFIVFATGYCDKDNTLHTYSITKDKNLLNLGDHASLPLTHEEPF